MTDRVKEFERIACAEKVGVIDDNGTERTVYQDEHGFFFDGFAGIKTCELKDPVPYASTWDGYWQDDKGWYYQTEKDGERVYFEPEWF